MKKFLSGLLMLALALGLYLNRDKLLQRADGPTAAPAELTIDLTEDCKWNSLRSKI